MANKTIELDKNKITILYESGKTTEEISKLFSVTPPTIRRFMKKHDIEIRKSRNLLTAEQKQEAKNMRNSGMTIKEIADNFNVGPTCINSVFNKRPSNSKKTLISVSENFTDYTGYKPIEIAKERNKTNSELNIYIPEKWKW